MEFSIIEDRVQQSTRYNKLNLSTPNLTSNVLRMKNINLIFPSEKITIANSTASTSGNSISIGSDIGTGTNSINIGKLSNQNNANNSISIGSTTGQYNNQGNTICIGHQTATYGSKENSIILGYGASWQGNGTNSINIGHHSGIYSPVNNNSIAIGQKAGRDNQNIYSIALGYECAYSSQGAYSIAIGHQGGYTNQPTKTIILSASGSTFSPTQSSAFYVNPIRSQAAGVGVNLLSWDSTTKEVYLNTSKTFVIDHPLDNEKYLVHACLEGPEAGVYYRGKSSIVNGESVEVVLPEYVKTFSNFTVQISPVYDGVIKTYNTSEVLDGKFIVYGKNGKFNWIVHALRNQIDIEPIKSETSVSGEFPYRYIS